MLKQFLLLIILLNSTACVKTYHTSGHLFKEDEIQALKKIKTKEELEHYLGSPTTISDFGQETWYYITSKKENIAFLPDKVIEQNIIAITFTKDHIDQIMRYSEKDVKKVTMVSDYTAAKGNDITKAQIMFSNLGRFNANKTPEPPKPRSGF